ATGHLPQPPSRAEAHACRGHRGGHGGGAGARIGREAPADRDSILELTELTKRFGGLLAVDSVSLQIKRGEVFALIGPNGAGKTTIFNSVTGMFRPTSGRVVFDGRVITGSKPHEVARLGIART